MLLIAIPKSWSSSLLKYVQTQHKQEAKQMNLKVEYKCKISNEFKYMGNLHCCCVEINEYVVEQLIFSPTFFRQHIPPTENNLKVLEKFKNEFMVLLRNPDDCYNAYLRARGKWHPAHLSYYPPDLKNELRLFYELYISFTDNYIISPLTNEKINQFEKFYGFKIIDNPLSVFPKEKYSRNLKIGS